MTQDTSRRRTLLGFGVATTGLLAAASARATATSMLPDGAATLSDLGRRLAASSRRRDFKTVPMILETPDQWDDQALREVIAYRGSPRQAYDNTDIESPWLNLMRNAINTQVFSFRHPDFLVVSATHGSAHLALYDQAMWEKYNLATLAGHGIASNRFLVPTAAPAALSDREDPKSAYAGPQGNTIPTLQARGAVFLACHNAIWEQAAKVIATGTNPDRLSHEAMTAELTNHLIDGVVLTPGMVATLPELQMAGFAYAK